MKHTHSGYGFFPGGDPRRFTPDRDGTTEKELEAHRARCAAWDAAEKAHGALPTPEQAACFWAGNLHVSTGPLGSYTYDCDDPECEDYRAQEPLECGEDEPEPLWDIEL